MPPIIANCKKCNRVFQKVIQDFCSACIALEEEQCKVLYRILQKSAARGGIVIGELSRESGVSTEDIERFYLEGRLSTAGTLLKFQCQGCSVMIGEPERRGRYCRECSHRTANQAGVEVKSRQSLEKSEAEARRRQEQLELLKKKSPPPAENAQRRFGMVRHRQ